MWKKNETASGDTACTLPPRDVLPLRTIYIALLVLCLLSYRGILDNGLFNDDYSWLRAARLEMTPRNLFTYRVVDFFRPLVNFSFWAMERLSPRNVKLHYGFNIVLHALCSILVFHLVRRLFASARIALATAAFFAVTSTHAAAILWISARTTLLSTAFLLASLLALLSERRPAAPQTRVNVRPGVSALRLAAAGILYALALAAKEEAIAMLPIAAALYLLARRAPERSRVGGAGLAVLGAISLAYLLVRVAFMGGFVQDNWGPGAHVMRNVAGGFLYQFYPWPVFSLLYPAGTSIAEPAGAAMPELLVLPLVALLLLAARSARVSYVMNLAISWALLALVPVAPFRYRFFSTASISQSRYYYLSSVGTVLIVALLLSMLWSERSRRRQVLAVAAFLFLGAGYVVRNHKLEKKWDEYTRYNAGIVAAVVEESDAHPGVPRIAIQNPPMAFRYLEDAIALERPDWTVIAVADSLEAARQAPCVYISYSGEAPKIMRITRIESSP